MYAIKTSLNRSYSANPRFISFIFVFFLGIFCESTIVGTRKSTSETMVYLLSAIINFFSTEKKLASKIQMNLNQICNHYCIKELKKKELKVEHFKKEALAREMKTKRAELEKSFD